VTFALDHGGLASRHYQLAAFVPFQGDGEHADRTVTLREGVVLRTDDPDLPVDALALRRALEAPRVELWTGAIYDFPDEVSLFTTLSSRGVAQLHASQQSVDEGIVGRWALSGVPAMITGDSIAYRMARQVSDDPARYESGVIAHGPQAAPLAERYADLLRRWARDYCRRGTALFRYLPGSPAPGSLPSGALVKRHGLVTVTWP
jgi:protein-L-isoaspartate(D-aspartate) O-methyltransferase